MIKSFTIFTPHQMFYDVKRKENLTERTRVLNGVEEKLHTTVCGDT